MTTVNEYIKNNDNIRVRIAVKESRDDCDPFVRDLWEGMLYDIPEDLRGAEVIQSGWLLGGQINLIEVYCGKV